MQTLSGAELSERMCVGVWPCMPPALRCVLICHGRSSCAAYYILFAVTLLVFVGCKSLALQTPAQNPASVHASLLTRSLVHTHSCLVSPSLSLPLSQVGVTPSGVETPRVLLVR